MNKEYETPEFKMINFEVKNKIMDDNWYEFLGDTDPDGNNSLIADVTSDGDEVSANAFILNV